MKWTFRIALAVMLIAGMCGSTTAQRAEPTRIGFISYAPSVDKLLPEEQAAFEFCSKQLKLPATLITLEQIARGKGKLSEYNLIWWHYARGTTLPRAALAKPTIEAFDRYLRRGGNLLLSLQACQYVAPLGIDVAPDEVAWKARAEMPQVALRSMRGHAIFGMLPERFVLCGGGTLEPATYARWVKTQPKHGQLLARSIIGGQDQPTSRCIYEWFSGKGRVLAIGEYGFRFTGPNGKEGLVNLQFSANVVRYLVSPVTLRMMLRPKGKTIAAAPVGYLSKIASANTLFVERGTPVEVEFSCIPHQEVRTQLQIDFGQYDEERSKWHRKDTVILREIDLKPGREVREKGRFNTGVKPGLYLVVCWLGTEVPPSHIQRVYVVRRSEPGATLSDKALVYTIETDQWLVELEKVTGAIKGLTHKKYPNLNFAANEFNSPLAGSKNPVLLGDFFVTSRTPRSQWLEEGSIHSTDVRTVAIEGDKLLIKFLEPSGKLGGFNNVRCVSSFSLNRRLNCLEWLLTIKNAGRGPVEVGDVYVPLGFNTSYAHLLTSLNDIFDKRLIMRPDICGASSHIVLQPRSGDPPFLVLVPAPGTPIECLAHDQKANKSAGRDWEGLPYLYIYSKASKEIENWGGWFNGHRSFTLDSGESRTLALRLFWAWSYGDIDTILSSQGRLVTHLSPGYVVPANMPATLRLRCSLGVGKVAADKGTTIEKLGEKGHTYRLTFSRPGRHKIKVTHGRGEATYLHLYSLPPLPEIAAARATFILEHQQFKSSDDRRRLAFGMWDVEDQMLLQTSENKELAGGSTVVGIGPPLFLAAKNTVFPDADEVKALERYIGQQLFGRIQDKNSYGVHAFVDKDGDGPTSRSYVYPHVFNLYFSMYRIGKYYGLTQTPAVNYLKLAHRTAMAYLGHQMDGQTNLAFGNPGEGTMVLIVAALRREGLSPEAAQLREAISRKLEVLAKRRLLAYGVLASGRLWPADTAGISGTYWLSRFSNWKDGLTRSLKLLAATRGNGRHWMWYGGDIAWAAEIAKYPTLEATTLNHPSAYNAAALLDAAVLWRNSRYVELGYAGVLGPWARVKRTGEAQGFYCWEPKLARFDPYSGDVDAALAPTFLHLGAYVAIDRSFGLVGYGCHVASNETAYTIVPADGMGKRVVSVPHRLVFEVGADLIKKVTVTKKADRMDVEIARGWPDDHDGRFALTGVAAGSWALSLDGGQARPITSEQFAAGITIPFKDGRTGARLTITKQAGASQ